MSPRLVHFAQWITTKNTMCGKRTMDKLTGKRWMAYAALSNRWDKVTCARCLAKRSGK